MAEQLILLIFGIAFLLLVPKLIRNLHASVYAATTSPLSFDSTRKGRLGELETHSELLYLSRRPEYGEPFDDLLLPAPDGSTQIDHVLVSVYGIFVIETKKRSGWIFGDARSREWTQVNYGRKYRFRNPIHQNFKHVVAVRDYLGVGQHNIHSIVVFSGDYEFKTDLPANVVDIEDLIPFIRAFEQPVLSEEQAGLFQHMLETALHDPQVTDLNHRDTLRRAKSDPRCPRCGRKMLIRTAKKGPIAGGQFWGCSGFPACRAVRQLD